MTASLTLNDPRVTETTNKLSTGRTYHYFILPPADDTPIRGTIVLLHGFPDLPYGWRHQAPAFAAMGLRVIMPSMLGYSKTDAPADPSEYTFAKVAADIVALVKVAEDSSGKKLPVMLGGHDWGCIFAWHIARRYPDVFKSVFGVCVPYNPPATQFCPLEMVVQFVPSLRYMLSFSGPELEKELDSDPKLVRSFLDHIYHPKGQPGFDPAQPVEIDVIRQAAPSTLMDDAEMTHMVREVSRNGMHGPLNYYRTTRANYDADLDDATSGAVRISQPSLFVRALGDAVISDAMCAGAAAAFDRLEMREIDASHWVLQGNKRDEATAVLVEWTQRVLGEWEENAKTTGAVL